MRHAAHKVYFLRCIFWNQYQFLSISSVTDGCVFLFWNGTCFPDFLGPIILFANISGTEFGVSYCEPPWSDKWGIWVYKGGNQKVWVSIKRSDNFSHKNIFQVTLSLRPRKFVRHPHPGQAYKKGNPPSQSISVSLSTLVGIAVCWLSGAGIRQSISANTDYRYQSISVVIG